MDRDILNYNPLVTNKIQQNNLEKHYQRLNSIKVYLILVRPPIITGTDSFILCINPIEKPSKNSRIEKHKYSATMLCFSIK